MTVQLIGIYVALDVLLDTRIGTVAKLCGNDVAANVLSANYHARLDDKFPSVDVDAYKAMYAKRDLETLSLSTLTGAMAFLQTITSSLMQQVLTRPYHDGVRVVVNTYPYQLDEEDNQLLLDGLAEKMSVFARVEIPFKLETIFKSDIELTPEFCKDNFAAMLMYEYDNWFFLQQHAFIKRPAPEVTVYAPAIYHVQTPTEEEIEEARAQLWHPLEAIMKTARGWIDLQLIDVVHFSIVKPN